MTNIYKIKDKITGLYSMGGTIPYFNKRGKTWSSRGAVSNHIRLARYPNKENIQIIEIQVEHVPVNEYDYVDWVNDLNEKSSKRKLAQKLARERAMQEYRLKQYKELQKEFGDGKGK